MIEEGRKWLLERRGEAGPSYLRGLWGFPAVEAEPERGREALRRLLQDGWGLPAEPGESLGLIRHSITFRRIRLRPVRFHLPGRRLPPAGRTGSRLAWADLESLGRGLPASSLALKVRRALLGEPRGEARW